MQSVGKNRFLGDQGPARYSMEEMVLTLLKRAEYNRDRNTHHTSPKTQRSHHPSYSVYWVKYSFPLSSNGMITVPCLEFSVSMLFFPSSPGTWYQ